MECLETLQDEDNVLYNQENSGSKAGMVSLNQSEDFWACAASLGGFEVEVVVALVVVTFEDTLKPANNLAGAAAQILDTPGKLLSTEPWKSEPSVPNLRGMTPQGTELEFRIGAIRGNDSFTR